MCLTLITAIRKKQKPKKLFAAPGEICYNTVLSDMSMIIFFYASSLIIPIIFSNLRVTLT